MDGNRETVPAGLAYTIIGVLVVLVICSFVFAGWSVLQFINRPYKAVLSMGKSIEITEQEAEGNEEENAEEDTGQAAGGPAVMVYGTPLSFGEYRPVAIDEQIFVPVEGVFKALGYTEEWDGLTSTAKYSGANNITITVDEDTFIANGEVHTLDTPARFIDGVAMLPVATLLESVGYSVAQNINGVYVVRKLPDPPAEPAPQPSAAPTARPARTPAPAPAPCSPCGATGVVTCTSCNGIGGGRGVAPGVAGIPYAVNPVSDAWYCTTCGGGKTVTCRACSGSGSTR